MFRAFRLLLLISLPSEVGYDLILWSLSKNTDDLLMLVTKESILCSCDFLLEDFFDFTALTPPASSLSFSTPIIDIYVVFASYALF
jgi:hypothetical protein